MNTIDIIKSASFDELSEVQKKQAIDYMRDTFNDTWYFDDVISDEKESLSEYGINTPDIQYSGWCTQGDGASISTDSIDPEVFLRKVKKWSMFKVLHKYIKNDQVSVAVHRSSSRYCHENTVYGDAVIDYNIDISTKQEKKEEELSELVTEVIRDLSRDVYKKLEAENEYRNSDECITENIQANDYQFKVNSTGQVLGLV